MMGRVACLQCSSGASGDMIVGALLDLGADPSVLEEGLRKLPLPGFHLQVEEVLRRGLRARKFTPRFTSEGKGLRTLGQVKEALRRSGLEGSLVRVVIDELDVRVAEPALQPSPYAASRSQDNPVRRAIVGLCGHV